MSLRALGLAGLSLAFAGCAHRPAALADLAWIGGCWENVAHTQFERWMPERNGVREGAGHQLKDGQVTFSETMRLEQRAEGVVFIGQPQGQAPVEFRLVETGPQEAVFANPAHDDPKRIRYVREGETLRAWTSDGQRETLVLDVQLSGCD